MSVYILFDFDILLDFKGIVHHKK